MAVTRNQLIELAIPDLLTIPVSSFRIYILTEILFFTKTKKVWLLNLVIVKVKQDLIFLVQEEIIQSKIRFVHKNNHIQDFDQDKLNSKQLNQRIKYLIFYENLEKLRN